MEIWKPLVTNIQFCGAKDFKKSKYKKIPKGLFLENLEDRTTPTSTAQLLKFAPEETTLLGPRPTNNIDSRPSIVFLDQDLLGRVPQEELNRSTVISINHQSDPLEQMTEALSGLSNIEVVRIISHGRDGALVFGESVIDDYQLQTHEKELNDWAKALAPDADILLYGCSVASTSLGKNFGHELSLLTGADVAASSNVTGAKGDLRLEYSSGNVKHGLLANAHAWDISGVQLPTFGDFTYSVNGSSITITSYTGTGGAVSIPAVIAGLPVKVIGHHAFWNPNGSSLTSVTIPEGVLIIEDFAFHSCAGLTSINLPNTLTSIGVNAFNSCWSLTSITIPSAVNSIGGDSFYGCKSLTNIIVSPFNTSYSNHQNDGVLYNKNQTILIKCPDQKTGSFIIHSSVLIIGKSAFHDCTRLTDITINSELTTIGDYAFYSCSGLGSIYALGNAPLLGTNALTNVSAPLFFFKGTSGWTNPWGGLTTVARNIPTTCTLIPSSSSSVYGVSFSLTVQVVSDFGNPLGPVTLKDGNTTIGIASLNNGVCTFTFNQLSAGDHLLNAEYAISGNFDKSSSSPITQTITKKNLIITGTTANDKIYDGTFSASLNTTSSSLEGVLPGDQVNLVINAVGTFASANVGRQNVSVSGFGLSGSAAGNYSLTQPTTTALISAKALAIAPDNKSKVYGAALPTLTATYSGLVNGDTPNAINGLVLATTALASSNVGTYSITASGATSSNYNITFLPGLLSITKAALSILADNKFKVYGASLPLFTNSLAGLVNGDTNSAITGLGVTTPATVSSGVGSYTLRPTGSNSNYDITFVDGTLSVTKAPLIVQAENQSYIRGLQAYPVFTYTISGFVNGDNGNSLNGSPELNSNAKEFGPFGTYPILVNVSNISSNNYSITGLNGILSINKVASSIIPVESIPILTTTNGAANGITIWGAAGKKLGSLNPYPGYSGRIVTALGDLNGDGVPDIITGVGAGTSPLLRRFDGRTLKEINQGFYAYDKAFMGGMSVAAADVDGDGLCEIITGTGNGSAPHVKVRKMDGTIIASFYAYAPEFTRGVNLITGDFDGDGKSEIVSTPNWGGGPHVKVFDGKGKASASFFAYESNFIGGFSLALADTDGNGTKEIVTESYAGRITSGRIFDPKGKMLREWFPHGTISSGGMVIAADLNGDRIDEIVSVPLQSAPSVLKVFDGGLKLTASALPYPASFTSGISIKAVDLNADGIKEIVTSPRAGLAPQVRRFAGTLKLLDSLFAANTSFTGGIWLD